MRLWIHDVDPTTSAFGLKNGRPVKYLVVILAIALGVAAVVYGGTMTRRAHS